MKKLSTIVFCDSLCSGIILGKFLGTVYIHCTNYIAIVLTVQIEVTALCLQEFKAAEMSAYTYSVHFCVDLRVESTVEPLYYGHFGTQNFWPFFAVI